MKKVESIKKKKEENSYSKIPVYGYSSGDVITRSLNDNNQPGENIVTPSMDSNNKSKDQIDEKDNDKTEENESSRYNYIGYAQDYSLDNSQTYVSVEVLKKMALDAFRAKNYYLAMQYFNKILIKYPTHKEALFFKKKVIAKLKELKRNVV
jgi:hypothetical protein